MTEATLNPAAFASKGKGAETNEKASTQSHFLHLCRMLGEPAPHDADQIGQFYALDPRERGLDTGLTCRCGGTYAT